VRYYPAVLDTIITAKLNRVRIFIQSPIIQFRVQVKPGRLVLTVEKG
jgi:hypothetical protein